MLTSLSRTGITCGVELDNWNKRFEKDIVPLL